MKPKTVETRVKELLAKDEPTYGFMELSNIELATALNWYNQFSDKEASHKFLATYCGAHGIKLNPQQITQQVATLGFVCRMLTLGAVLNDRSMHWLDDHLKRMTTESVSTKTEEPTPLVTPKPSIQDYLKQKTRSVIAVLEGAIDSLILSDFKTSPNTASILRSSELNSSHGPQIINWAKHYRDEYRIAIQGSDAQVVEAYDNYTRPQLKKMEALYDQIISDMLAVMGETKKERKPRAKKQKTPGQQVKKLQYCPSDTELKLTSVTPTRIIGAEGLWCYNRVTRMLTHYVADDAAGLGIKGCTVLNYSKDMTRSKKLRKPEVLLPQVLSGGKVVLRKLFDELTTKDAKVTGRINKDTVLVRVIS